MADLETDLKNGGINYFDSGGTYDPHLTGPSQPFGPSYAYPVDQSTGPSIPLRSPIARAILAITCLLFAAFALAAIFFLEPLSAIFFR